MSTASLIEKYVWSPQSVSRNELTAVYEPVQPFLLIAMTRRLGDVTFIDAGANIGFYTVVIGSEPNVTEVLAFEPMPRAASAVRWNAEANLAAKSVTIHELALSARSGQLQFAVRSPLAGDNGALRDTVLADEDFEVQLVCCERLDDLFEAVGGDIVVKVDVEGHELSLLQGATRTLARNRGFLQIEMHESPTTAEKITFLNELGWHQLARIKSDFYFTNIPEYLGESSKSDILEEAMQLMVDASKGSWRESRRRIGPGVYLHVSRKQVNAIKRLLGR